MTEETPKKLPHRAPDAPATTPPLSVHTEDLLAPGRGAPKQSSQLHEQAGNTAAHSPDKPSGPRLITSQDLPGGVFLQGDDSGEGYATDGEGPAHQVRLSPFSIDATTVTNAEFHRFTQATGYVTSAEAAGFSTVFHLLVAAPETDILGYPSELPWWRTIRRAAWRRPFGARSFWEEIPDHPVVHISFYDAQAYCDWAGRALPTESQWEYASRGGRISERFPWGNDLPAREAENRSFSGAEAQAAEAAWPLNIWQGNFPEVNTRDDGYLGTAPAQHFSPNGFGLYQTLGNVWEWCSDRFSAREYRRRTSTNQPAIDPQGPDRGNTRVLRGGSYLCHDSYCYRYRNAARSANYPDTTAGNIGFRTVGIHR